MRKPKPISPFKTLDEEADFWDSHDVSALFDNPKTPLSNLPLIEVEKEESITLRLQKTIKSKLSRVARSKGLSVGALSRMWLIEKLSQYTG